MTETGYMAFTVMSDGRADNATFQCLTATSDAAAQRVKDNLKAIRERQGFQHLLTLKGDSREGRRG